MSAYAERTSVDSASSRAEIERTLQRYGATAFTYGWTTDRAAIGFEASGRRVRFELPMPERESREFCLTPTGRERTAAAATKEYEQAVRQRWRALALVIKAKLEAVGAGIVTFEEEFLAHIVLPSGRTVAQDVTPAIEVAYTTGRVAPLQITDR